MTIGQLIKKHCEDNQITQREFADKVGMTHVAISRLVQYNDKLPSIPYIKNIAKALGLTYMGLIIEHYATWEEDGR